MTKIKFKNTLESLLKKDSRLVDENKELNLAAIRDLADKTDAKLIELLLSNDEAVKKFFLKVPDPNSSGKDVLVFKQNDFKFFLDGNQIDNSYTAYENRIGLTIGNQLLKDSGNVVLNFPFKDCVLEGGQSTEEGTDDYFEYNEDKEKYEVKVAKRKEIFFNEVLAQDEIDWLYEPKAFTNIKKYTAKGEEKIKEFTRNQEGIITDNLIIKGNNLLALHSLKEEFSGKVKLIYIDPPYNTGGSAETFIYNNFFKHSSWLTFMKNRLEIAKNLLRDDGFIAIAIDHNELFYLGTLTDEIFGRDNRLGIITVVHKPEGRQFANFFSASNEFMLVYAINKNLAEFESIVLDIEKEDLFNENDEAGLFRFKNFIRLTDGKYSLRKNKPDGFYPIYVSKDLKHFSLTKEKDYEVALPITDKGVERVWKTSGKTFIKKVDANQIIAERENGKIVLYEKLRASQVFTTHWINKKYHSYHFGTKLLEETLGKKVFSFPKSVYTVLDTLKIMTSDDDIILDFFVGSGTTAHALMELNKEDGGNRKFILVEQLDYVEDVTVKRVHQVIKNNKSGSFIYLELAKWNEEAKEKIADCKSLKELEKLLNELSEKYFLHYNVKLKEFKEKIIHEENFKKLPLKNQQEMFCKMLDLNQLYVNASEMEDKKYGLSKEDIALTKVFYSKIK